MEGTRISRKCRRSCEAERVENTKEGDPGVGPFRIGEIGEISVMYQAIFVH